MKPVPLPLPPAPPKAPEPRPLMPSGESPEGNAYEIIATELGRLTSDLAQMQASGLVRPSDLKRLAEVALLIRQLKPSDSSMAEGPSWDDLLERASPSELRLLQAAARITDELPSRRAAPVDELPSRHAPVDDPAVALSVEILRRSKERPLTGEQVAAIHKVLAK